MPPPAEWALGERPFPVALRRVNGRTAALLLFLALLAWSCGEAGLLGDEPLVNTGGWSLAARFLAAAVRPDLSAEITRLLLPSAGITLAYAVCGTTLCVVIGIVFGIALSEIWGGGWGRVLRATLPAALAFPRAIHEAVWGLFFINIFGLNPLSAILAIAVPFGAITAKVFAEILDETPRDAFDALRAAGASPASAFCYGLLPLAFPFLLAYAVYRFECSLRAAVVLGLIGAGGLGFQILLSLQSLRYEQVWTFLYALIVLVGVTDAWSSLLNRRLSGRDAAFGVGAELHAPRERPAPREPQAPPESPCIQPARLPDTVFRASLGIAALLIPLCFWKIGADWSLLFSPRTARLWADFARHAFPPRGDAPLLTDLAALSAQTLAMSILAITLAGLGGLILSFPAAANFALPGSIFSGTRRSGRALPGWTTLLLTRGALLVARALSESVWVLLVLFVLFPGVLPGAVALGLYNLGVLGRLMAEVTENMDERPPRALAAQGASPAQVFLYGVLPASLPRCVAYILYRWEVCIRATAVVGIVGAGGLGRRLSEQLTRFEYPAVMTTLCFYLVLTFLVDRISAAVRRTLR